MCVPAADVDHEHPVLAYASAPRGYGLSAINDQHLAGASMCFIEALVFGMRLQLPSSACIDRSDSRMTLVEYAAGEQLPT